MNNKIELLNTIFNKLNLSEIFDDFFNNKRVETKNISSLKYLKERTKRPLYSYYSEYSYDDVELKSELLNTENAEETIFEYLIEICDSLFVFNDSGDVLTEFMRITEYTKLTNKIDQDILISHFVSNDDVSKGKSRNFSDLTWKSVTNTNSSALSQLLNKGYSENHFHVGGSSQNYKLSWISLMNCANDVSVRRNFKRYFSKSLNTISYLGEFDNKLYDYVQMAYIIRMILYLLIIDDRQFEYIRMGFATENVNVNRFKLLKREFDLSNLLDESSLQYNVAKVQSCIKSIHEFKEFNNTNQDFDYAGLKIKNMYSELLGERYINYEVCISIRSKQFCQEIHNLYFIYLLIMSKFRGELIQLNDRFGFFNFKEYQDRKSKLISTPKLITKYSIEKTLYEQENIRTLEGRLMPNWDVNVVKGLTEKYDDKVHLVFHLGKSKENYPAKRRHEFAITPRNNNTRILANEFTNKMILERNKNNPILKYITGIDCCSNEIGCRPETFAYMYRALKRHIPEYNDNYRIGNNKISKLGYTYHAGEDFLDVVDGLRSIDEVTKYLSFRDGDRIGHGIALGINIRSWYESKGREIYLRKQDLLDNLIWIIKRSYDFEIPLARVYEDKIMRRIISLFNEIYSYCYKFSFELENYWGAMMLRADAPEMYESKIMNGYYNSSLYDYCATYNSVIDMKGKGSYLESLRNNEKISTLMYLYHYSSDVKMNGHSPVLYIIDEEYIAITEKLQTKMQEYIAELNIYIECNPTSNVLINNFNSYDKHPIFKLNNKIIGGDNKKDVKVTINTDDQGIFNNSLENEYALIYRALIERSQNTDSLDLITIENWLDQIRRFGNESSFFKSDNKKEKDKPGVKLIKQYTYEQ